MLVTLWPLNRPLLAGFLVSTYFYGLIPCYESQKPPLVTCKLNASSPFSNVVEVLDIWQEQENQRTPTIKGPAKLNFGCLITRTAVLSTAWTYIASMKNQDSWAKSGKYKRYAVIGQNLQDYKLSGLKHPCYQNRTVRDIQLHPRASQKGSRLHYDFSMIIMNDPFTMVGSTFPATFFPSAPLELLDAVRFVNVEGKKVTCALPVPSQESLGEEARWTFNDRIDVSSVPFKSQCILKNVICDQSEKIRQRWGPRKTEEIYKLCKKTFLGVVNGTMLCMTPLWTKVMAVDNPPVPTSYAGVPLECNGSTLGIISQVKKSPDDGPISFGNTEPQDVFLVITLLRILPWLTEKIQQLSPTTNDSIKVDGKPHVDEFPAPSRAPTPDWGHKDFLQPFTYSLPVDVRDRRPLSLAPAAMYHSPCFWRTLAVFHAFYLIYHIHFQ